MVVIQGVMVCLQGEAVVCALYQPNTNICWNSNVSLCGLQTRAHVNYVAIFLGSCALVGLLQGFEWNKYNQTHYDTDSPPPKIVQGYKFNVRAC